MPDYYQTFYPNEIYHVFNRAVGNDLLFKNDENYRYFLEKMKTYILPIADILTFSLMPNHFHWLIQFKNENESIEHLKQIKKIDREIKVNELPVHYSKQISNLLNGYS